MVEVNDRSQSSSLPGHHLVSVAHGGSTPQGVRAGPLSHDHVVRFYEDDEGLADVVAGFLGAGLRAGDRVAVIATASHRAMFQRRLAADGFEVDPLIETGTLTVLDAHDTLATFMRAGEPDRARFEAEIGGLVARLSGTEHRGPLHAYGEMVDVLWMAGQRTAALTLEGLWNDLQDRHPFTLLCAYSMASFYKEPAAIQQVCATHTHVVTAEVAAGGEPAGDAQVHATEPPPQHARQLAREIAHRSEVELALRESLRELRHREEQLRHSEQQLRDFVENATVGLHQVGPDGTILWANRAELELLGYTCDEYIGRSIIDVHADRPVIDDILATLHRGEPIHDREARLRAKDGSIRHVLISSNVHSHDGRFVNTRCFTRDITEKKRAEEALRTREAQLQTIIDALPVLVAYVDVDRRYQLVSAGYERWFDSAKAAIQGKPVSEVIGPAAYEVVRPHLDRAFAGELVTYEAEVPYLRGTKFVHATCLPQREPGGQISGVVTLIADITERKSFEHYRAAAAERAERLLTITSALADAVTPGEVFEAVVDRVAAAVGASSAALWLVDDDSGTARLARAIGDRVSVASVEALPLDGTSAIPELDAIRRAEPIWIASQAALLRDYPQLAAAVDADRSYRVSCLPLISDGRTLGALGVTVDEAREATEEERSFLLLVARYAGQAIERVRLLEAERRSRADADAAAVRMGVLSHASRVFVEANLDLPTRLEAIVREMGRVFDGSAGISLIEGDGRLHTAKLHHPVPEAQRLLRSLVEASPVRLGEGITGGVAQHGDSVLVAGGDPREIIARAAPGYGAFVEQYPVYALMSAPVRTRERIIGSVTVSKIREGETYTHLDLELLEMLAERAASAIENARLHRDNIEARSRAEQLYRFAHAAASADKVEHVFDAGLDAIEATLGIDRAAVLLFDDDGVMRFRAWRKLSDDYRCAVEGHSPWSRDTVAPQPVLVDDVDADVSLRAYGPLFRTEQIRSLAFVPLVTRGKLLGKFMVYHREPHRFSTTEIELASAIGNHLASVTSRFAALAELERTVHYSELFAGVLAHDLRNPLGSIMTAAQLLLMRQEGEGGRHAKPMSRIVASGQRMARMIDQLLDFTRARVGGGIEIQARDTNLADLCSQAISELELVYTDRNIQCSVVGDLGGSWDPDRLLQIISNLVANASQHGSGDGPVVVELDGRQHDSVVLEIHNRGAISPALLPTLFDPFRGTRHRREHSRGLGLGLFIVRELVRAHGGTVEVTSSEAGGTTFRVRLPRRPAV
jgi:PAS domain S-box-containing protein